MELQSYLTLQKIKAIIHDDQLDDPERFAKIDAVFCELEARGGSRHDFG